MATRDELKRELLTVIEEAISRLQPVLEQEFCVQLGHVRVKEIGARSWLAEALTDAEEEWPRHRSLKRGRPPTRWEHLRQSFQLRVMGRVALPFVYLRFWWPGWTMQWSQRGPTIWISLLGLSTKDLERKMIWFQQHIDQLVVHELAHGVWRALSDDPHDEMSEKPEMWHAWRALNEGFAHYVADIHFRQHYTPDAQITDAWSSFRLESRDRVSELVNQHGVSVLRELPVRWREFAKSARER